MKISRCLEQWLYDSSDGVCSLCVANGRPVNRRVFKEPDELWHQASARQQGVSELAETLLISKTGSDRLTYYNRSAAPGLYSVVVVATRKDTSLRLYASTTPHSDAVYPPLPADPVVRVTAASREAISFAWKPAPATSSASAVQFCISVSALRHFRSQCAAHAHRYGDPEPPPPPYAGFGFAKERGRRRRGRKNGRRTPSTSPPPVTTARPDGDDSGVLECIGTATNYIYREPNVGRKYYIDVYAVNVVTNASMSYDGASVKVPRRSSSRSPGRLAVDRSSRVVLKTSRPEKTFKYRVTGRQPASLNIYVRSCEMPPPAAVRVQLEREADGEVLATHVVTESLEQALHVDSLAPGSYRVKMVTADGRRPPSGRRYRWTVLVSTGDGSPYPQLPADARVRPASGNATDDCRSTTVQWPVAAATEAQRYCVYLEPVTTASSARLNVCVKSRRRRRKSIRVSCHVVPAATDDVELRRTNETMVQVISNMTPGRRYAVDVFASTVTTTTTAAAAPTKELLAYERLIVDVPNTC